MNESTKQGEARRETFGARAVVWSRRLDWAAIFASAASVAIFLFAGVGAALLCLATPGGSEGGFSSFVASTLLSCVRAAVVVSAVAWGALALRCAASFCAFFASTAGDWCRFAVAIFCGLSSVWSVYVVSFGAQRWI